VDYVAGKEVYVVVTQLDAGIADALSSQLVQLGVLDPLHALRDRGLVQVQLQHFHHCIEVLGGKSDHVFGDAVLRVSLSAVHSLQYAWKTEIVREQRLVGLRETHLSGAAHQLQRW